MINWIKKLFGCKPKVEPIQQLYECDSEDVIVKIHTEAKVYTIKFSSKIVKDICREIYYGDIVYQLESGKEKYEDWKDAIKKHTILNIDIEQIPIHMITKFEHEIVPVKIKSKHKIGK